MDGPEFLMRGVAPRASFGQRFLAYFVDIVVLNVASLVLGEVFFANGGPFLSLLVSFAYFVLLEGSQSGQTLGKRLLGIRVVDFETGEPIGHGRALARTVGRWISGIVLLLGYLWMLWDRDRQTWHDKIASTTVVPVARQGVGLPEQF